MINWRLPTIQCQPIGLDIGSSSIKMIQLAINGEHLRVIAADKTRVDPDIIGDAQSWRNFVISSVSRMLSENNFHGKNVITNLSNSDIRITNLRLSEHDDKLDSSIRKEAAVRFGFDSDKDMFDYISAGTIQQGEENKKELIVFGATDQAIRNHIKMIEEMKLKPAGIDVIPCSLFRSSIRFLRRQEDKENTVVLVDIGNSFTTVVFGRGGEISFVKQIPVGGERFNQRVASKLGISVKDAEMLRGTMRIERTNSINNLYEDDSAKKQGLDSQTRQTIIEAIKSVAEELVRDISLCLRYYTVTFRGNSIERAVLSGGAAYENILLETFKQQLGTEVEVSQPLRGFDISQVRLEGDLLCEWTVAAGLSLKGYKLTESLFAESAQVGKRAVDNERVYERN